MYVHPFILGIVFTVVVEMIVIGASAMHINRKYGGKKNEQTSDNSNKTSK